MNARLTILLWVALTLVAGLVTTLGPGDGQLPWWRACLSDALTFSPLVVAIGLVSFGRDRIAAWVGPSIIAGYVIVAHLLARWLERLSWTPSRLVLYVVRITIYGAGYLFLQHIVQRQRTPLDCVARRLAWSASSVPSVTLLPRAIAGGWVGWR